MQPWRGKWRAQGHVLGRAGRASFQCWVWGESVLQRGHSVCPWEQTGNQLKEAKVKFQISAYHLNILIGFSHLGSTLGWFLELLGSCQKAFRTQRDTAASSLSGWPWHSLQLQALLIKKALCFSRHNLNFEFKQIQLQLCILGLRLVGKLLNFAQPKFSGIKSPTSSLPPHDMQRFFLFLFNSISLSQNWCAKCC